MSRQYTYCCECKRAPCVCTVLYLAALAGVALVCLAGYGLYKLFT